MDSALRTVNLVSNNYRPQKKHDSVTPWPFSTYDLFRNGFFLDGWGDFDRPIMTFQVLNLEEKKIIEKPVSNVFT